MASSLRRHIMMQQGGGGDELVAIQTSDGGYIKIPNLIPSQVTVNSSQIELDYYFDRTKDTSGVAFNLQCWKYIVYVQTYMGSVDYNFLRYRYDGYANSDISLKNYVSGRNYLKLHSKSTALTISDIDGNVLGSVSFAGFIGSAPMQGEVIIRPIEPISRIYIPNVFDLVAAEQNGEYGFIDELTGIFYGKTSETGTLQGVYRSDLQ